MGQLLLLDMFCFVVFKFLSHGVVGETWKVEVEVEAMKRGSRRVEVPEAELLGNNKTWKWKCAKY